MLTTKLFKISDDLLEIETTRVDPRGMASVVMREHLNLKEAMVRRALIEMGWTPPCEHLYVFFGDQTRRRCSKCNKLEADVDSRR